MFINTLAVILTLIGVFFFLAGTVGLMRLPDVYCRLHALTKADNLGLGFIVAGLALYSLNIFVALKLLMIWWLVLFASAVGGHLVAKFALEEERNQ